MTGFEWFATVGMPLVIVIFAFGVLKLYQRDLSRRGRMHPGE
jgi:hypothetical protein